MTTFHLVLIILPFSYATVFHDGVFTLKTNPIPTEWFHLVLNFIDPMEGFAFYYDGEKRPGNVEKLKKTFATGSGEVVIGACDGKYSSVMIDELLFFNRMLTLNEIQILYNMDE